MAVVVVGAGILGASVAYHLAVLGVRVTVVDRAGAASGVTGASFGWIGDTAGDWPGGAADLRPAVLRDHRRLERAVAGAEVRWTGSLTWPEVSPGRGGRMVGPEEIAELEPRLADPPDRAVHRATDAGIDAAGTTRALLRAASECGARTVLDAGTTTLRVDHGRVAGVQTSSAVHPAATVVVAAGTGTPELTAPLGVPLPMIAAPALLVRAEAPAGLVRSVVAAPGLEVREVRPGDVLMTAPIGGDRSPGALRRRAQDTVARLRVMFRSDGPVRLRGWAVGDRPMPVDGPLIGHLTADRSAYVAVMHSAATLAPTVGRLVAQEIITGQEAPELRRCRPAGR